MPKSNSQLVVHQVQCYERIGYELNEYVENVLHYCIDAQSQMKIEHFLGGHTSLNLCMLMHWSAELRALPIITSLFQNRANML